MELENQNIIAETLKNMGVSENEIQTRLMKAKLSTSGAYDPISDSYNDMAKNEPSEAFKIPLPTDADVKRVLKEPVGEVAAEPSNLPALSNYDELSESDGHKRVGMFVIRTANETLQESNLRPDPKNLCLGLWYQGELCCCFADSYVGKSLYAVQMGTAISAEQIVLYFDFELSDKMFELRYKSESGELYRFPEKFYRVSVDPNQLNVGEDFETVVISNIEETTIEMGASVIIVDNLTWICQACEKGEAAAALMKDLWRMTRKHGWSILIISHTPKRNLQNPITQNDLSGSKRLFNFFDSCFSIGKSARNESERYVKQLKCRSGLLEYHSENVLLCKIEKSGAFTSFEHIGYASEKELLRESESEDERLLRDAIYELADQGLSYQAIADQLGSNKSKVCRVLKRRKK